jgi:NAD(P)-dependent dehydrogenase (short-subunit alcohol dehydrogenase family)
MDFKNKIVLITGGSRGIGKATAIEFANRGADVIINYQSNKKAAEETLTMLKGNRHTSINADLNNVSEIEQMFDQILKKYNRLDIVINNAGISIDHDPNTANFEEWNLAWRQILETNLLAPANVCYFASKIMKKQGGGRIVNVSSRGAFRGEPTKPAYGASKAALNSLTQSLAKALGPYNIFVAAVAPGFVDTDMAKETLTPVEREAVENDCPLKRIAKPEEVAYSIAFLASERSAFSTGAILDINGASYLRT